MTKIKTSQLVTSVITDVELDTGTDDVKYTTAKAIKDSHNVPNVVPSTVGNVLTSDGTDWISSDLGNYQINDADLSAIAALGFTSTSLLRKTAINTWELDTTVYTSNVGTITSIETSGAILGGTITDSGTISHSAVDGFLHVPVTSTINNGKVLTAGNTAGSFSWEEIGTGTGDITEVNITAGNGLLGSVNTTTGVHTQTIYIESSTGTAGTVGTLVIEADAIGVSLGATSTTAAAGNHTHSYDNYGYWTLNTDGAYKGLISTHEVVNFVGGTNMTIAYSSTNNTITFNSATGGYTHPSYTARNIDTTGAQVIDIITSDTIGSVTNITTRTMTLANIGYTGATDANNYTHPNHTGHVTSTTDGDTVLTVSGITGQTELTSGLVSTDEFIINDGGVIKRMDVTVLQTYMQTNLTLNDGTVESVIAGNGLDFTTFTVTGSIILGTPTTLTASTTNAVTSLSHTHAITGFSETGHTHSSYVSNDVTGEPTGSDSVLKVVSLTQAEYDAGSKTTTTLYIIKG